MKKLIIILIIAFNSTLIYAQQNPPPIDLSGTWKLNTEEIVVITQSGNQVTAVFSPSVQCHNEIRTTLFISPFDFNTLTLGNDQFWACTREQKLIDDCGLTPVYQTKFHADVSPDGNMIQGQRFSEGWTYDEKDGKWVNCRLDSQFDRWIDFSLTRVKKPCDDFQHQYDSVIVLIENHDAEMQSIVKQYDTLYTRLAELQARMKQLRSDAEKDWDKSVWNKWKNSRLDNLVDFLPFPLPLLTNLPFTAVQLVIGFCETYKTYHVTVNDIQDWCKKQPSDAAKKMLDLVNYLNDMGTVACQMTELKKRYDYLEKHRETLVIMANDARKEFDDCQKGNK